MNESDKCINDKYENNIFSIIYLYIDDILIFHSNNDDVNVVKSLLCNNFDMKYLGEANVTFDIKISRSQKPHFKNCFLPPNMLVTRERIPT